MTAQTSEPTKDVLNNEAYLLGKLVTFTFKEAASSSSAIEGVVAGFAQVGAEQYAYMHTSTGEEFFVPLSNVAYLMVSNQGIPSSKLLQDGEESAYAKLPSDKRPPMVEEPAIEDEDMPVETGASDDQMVRLLGNVLKGGTNEAK